MISFSDTTANFSEAVLIGARSVYEFLGAPQPDGVTQKGLPITLNRNSVVRKYEVIVQAAAAKSVAAGEAGQVRTMAGSDGTTVVLDFGTPRTVSAIQAPSGVLMKSIRAWAGTQFANPQFIDETGENFVTLDSELRTEKLQIVVSGSPSTQTLATDTRLVVPESPAGIELRIDGAAPVFSQASAVVTGASETLSTGAWNNQSQRVVDLGPALSALTSNPLDDSSVTFTATLTSRVPGKLDLQARPDGQEVLRIRRATFNSQTSHDLTFDEEGKQTLALDSLPANLTVPEVRLTVAGTPPPLRVVPPVGPDPPNPLLAIFSLTAERAACIALPVEPRFVELSGLRVPLAVGQAGVEARVLIWRSKDLVDTSPAEALPDGATDPLTLAPGDEAWRTFSWKKAIHPPANCVLWAVVMLNRGDATSTLTDASAGTGAERLLWGAPTGPFHDLPSSLASARGRIRVIGRPRPDAAFAPLRAHVGTTGTTVDVMPNARGTVVDLTGSGGPQTGATTLVLTSYAPSTVTLRDIDVISTT